MDTSDAPCELLPWDTKFFGVQIARVRGDVLTHERCTVIDAWCAAHAVACLYFTARPDDAATVQLAEQHGYHLVDIRMTFQIANLKPSHSNQNVAISDFESGDLTELRRMARASHQDTRFFF